MLNLKFLDDNSQRKLKSEGIRAKAKVLFDNSSTTDEKLTYATGGKDQLQEKTDEASSQTSHKQSV
jgi:hypothetical protein